MILAVTAVATNEDTHTDREVELFRWSLTYALAPSTQTRTVLAGWQRSRERGGPRPEGEALATAGAVPDGVGGAQP